MKKSDLVLSLGQRLLLLLCVFLVCYVLTIVMSYVTGRLLGHNAAASVRISAVFQDVFTFIVPAVATALFVSRRPASLLCLEKAPTAPALFLVAIILFASVPAQEAVIYWNYHLSLPASLSSFEAAARAMENTAFQTLKTLMADTSALSLIVNLLIVGVFAGFSEELLFRGCFQRLLTTGGVNRHVAVWTVAVCFSALHFQFFGFVPRVLLGAYFGYLLLWSGSIWLPVTAHVLNNIMFVLTAWHQARVTGLETIDNEPSLWSWPATAISLALTATAIYALWRKRMSA